MEDTHMDTPSKDSPLFGELQRLEKRVEDLQNVAMGLSDRLKPVSQPGVPAPRLERIDHSVIEKTTSERGVVVSRISIVSGRVASVISILDEAVGRLEL